MGVGTNAVNHCSTTTQNSLFANSLDGTGFAKWANSEVQRSLMNPSSEEEELLPNPEKVRVSTTERRLPDDSFITKMKKYTKLILSVVAVISFFSFIFYKFRYDRLYNVMQVLEVFGTRTTQACSLAQVK